MRAICSSYREGLIEAATMSGATEVRRPTIERRMTFMGKVRACGMVQWTVGTAEFEIEIELLSTCRLCESEVLLSLRAPFIVNPAGTSTNRAVDDSLTPIDWFPHWPTHNTTHQCIRTSQSTRLTDSETNPSYPLAVVCVSPSPPAPPTLSSGCCRRALF